MLASSVLLGRLHASEDKNFADISVLDEAVPFDEAVSFLRSKVSLTKKDWLSLEQKLRFRAFTVAYLSEADNIEAVRGVLTKAVKNGMPLVDAIDTMQMDFNNEQVKRFSGYFETVYRTNVQSAYNAGRLMQYQHNMPTAWELLVIDDERTSGICKGLPHGALSVTHPFWNTYGFPPYHFNCRTTFRAVYADEIGHGIQIEKPTMKSLRAKFKPQKGFGGNPLEKESWWKITPGMMARAKRYGITGEIVAQAREFDMQSYFPELLQGYDKVYKGKKKGGYVHVAKNCQYSEAEKESAKRLADLGHEIYLLPRTKYASSPDMLIDNEIGEMKHIISTKYGTIRDHVKKAGGQQRARVMYLHIENQKQLDRLIKILKEEIKALPTEKVLIDFNGIITEYTRKFFI